MGFVFKYWKGVEGEVFGKELVINWESLGM